MILILLLVTATFRPAAPTVGDPITVDFQESVRLDPSPSYEIVSQQGKRAVVRTFTPRPITLTGESGGVRFNDLRIPVRSVLKPGDKMEPSGLKQPIPPVAPREPLIAIAIAGSVALLSWLTLIALSRRKKKVEEVVPDVPAAEHFRRTVLALIKDGRAPLRWAALADATRRYLASLTPYLGSELTTTQLLARIDAGHVGIVSDILRRGDAEKFSPWGAPPGDFDTVATRALDLIPAPVQQEAIAA